MTVPLFRNGKVLLTANNKLATNCGYEGLELYVRIIWPSSGDITASISIPSGYFIWEDHYDGQWWWYIDAQQIYEDGLFNSYGEYTFTVTVANPDAIGVLYISFLTDGPDDSKDVTPAASTTVTLKLNGTITLS